MLDAKWLEILEKSGGKTAAVAATAALLIYGNSRSWFPVAIPTYVLVLTLIIGLLCGFLTLASLVSYCFPRIARAPVWERRRTRKHVIESIPQMSPKEREIIGYLLAHNQRMFTNTSDGGYATTLISKGIVERALRPGQAATYYEIPFEVPAHIWRVLVEHKESFPYEWRPFGDEAEPHPWRVHAR